MVIIYLFLLHHFVFFLHLRGSSLTFILLIFCNAFSKYRILLFVASPSVILKGRLTKPSVWLPTRRCDEHNFCSLNAKLDELEEDPCPKTEKYLEAHYVCHSLIDGPPTQGWSNVSWEIDKSNLTLRLNQIKSPIYRNIYQHNHNSKPPSAMVDNAINHLFLPRAVWPRYYPPSKKSTLHCAGRNNNYICVYWSSNN